MSSEFSKSNRQISYERQNSDIWKPYTVCGYTVTAITTRLFHIHVNAIKLLHSFFVKRLQETIQRNGYIYKGSYAGWYCVADEAFVAEKDVEEIKNLDGSTLKVWIELRVFNTVVTRTLFRIFWTGFQGKWQACGTTWGRELHVSFERISRATSQVDTNWWWDQHNSAQFSCKCHNQFAE